MHYIVAVEGTDEEITRWRNSLIERKQKDRKYWCPNVREVKLLSIIFPDFAEEEMYTKIAERNDYPQSPVKFELIRKIRNFILKFTSYFGIHPIEVEPKHTGVPHKFGCNRLILGKIKDHINYSGEEAL